MFLANIWDNTVDVIFFLSIAFAIILFIIVVLVSYFFEKKKGKAYMEEHPMMTKEEFQKAIKDEQVKENTEKVTIEDSNDITNESENIDEEETKEENVTSSEDSNNDSSIVESDDINSSTDENLDSDLKEETESFEEVTAEKIDEEEQKDEVVQEVEEEANTIDESNTIENDTNNENDLVNEEETLEDAISTEEENTKTQEEVDNTTSNNEINVEVNTNIESNPENTSNVEEITEEKPEKSETKKTSKKTKVVPVKKGRTYNGKYEVYQVADGYSYHLKASNGEILVTGESYTTRDGAIKSIDAVKRNLETGEVKVFADKHGHYKFKLVSKNYRVLVISSNYSVEKSAVRAAGSFKKFALIADIVDVEEQDMDAKTAITITVDRTQTKDGGKFVIEKFDGEYSWALKASNGEILCQTEGYTTRLGCLNSIEVFKKNAEYGIFKTIEDKMGRFYYKLYSQQGRVCIVGESYSSKQSAESAANSTVAFYKNAKIEEIKEKNKK